MDSIELGPEDRLDEERLEAPPTAENRPPDEQKHAEEREPTPKKSEGPAWRRAVVPSLYIAGTGVFLYAAWKWLRPKDAPKKSKSTWTLDDTLGRYD